MINEQRVKLMTRMAAYEQDEYKKNIKITGFFRSDYIGFQLLKSIVANTIAFAILFCLYILHVTLPTIYHLTAQNLCPHGQTRSERSKI